MSSQVLFIQILIQTCKHKTPTQQVVTMKVIIFLLVSLVSAIHCEMNEETSSTVVESKPMSSSDTYSTSSTQQKMEGSSQSEAPAPEAPAPEVPAPGLPASGLPATGVPAPEIPTGLPGISNILSYVQLLLSQILSPMKIQNYMSKFDFNKVLEFKKVMDINVLERVKITLDWLKKDIDFLLRTKYPTYSSYEHSSKSSSS